MPTHQLRRQRRNSLSKRLSVATAAIVAPICIAPLAHAAEVAPTMIFVDGTKQIIANGNAEGAADLAHGTYLGLPYYQHEWVDYPRSFGVLTGPSDPGYDQSVTEGATNTAAAITQALHDNPGMPVVVVGDSQGSDAASRALADLNKQGVDLSNVYFVLAANPDNADGGILARIPGPGVYVPLLGITLGGQPATTPGTANVVQIVRQYDGVADAPKYILNPVADANAIAGFYYLHGHYSDVNLSDPNNVVTTTPDGKLTNVLVPTKTVPLLMLAEDLGVPKPLAEALDPLVRAVIETGYDRPVGLGSYPTQAVPFQLAPGPDQWAGDVQSVVKGAQESGQSLLNLANPGAGSTPPVQPHVDSLVSSQQTSEPQQDVVQPQQVSKPVQPNDVQQPVQHEKPLTNLIRSSLNASGGASSNGSSSTGTHKPGPVSQAVNGTVKSITSTVNNFTHAVTGALTPKKPATTSGSAGTSSSTSGSSGSSGS